MLDGSHNAQNPPNYTIQTTCTSVIPTNQSTLSITPPKPQNFVQHFKQDNIVQLDSLSANTTSHVHAQDVDHILTRNNTSPFVNNTRKTIQYPKMISTDDILTHNP